MSLPSPAYLFASLLWGSIGLGLFIYGKKSVSWKPMVGGVILMIYPYFVDQIGLLYALGILLCAALYIFRD